MYKSEKLFVDWLKNKGFKDTHYSQVSKKGFPDFVVYLESQDKMIWVECKRYIYQKKPCVTNLSLLQREWILNKKDGYVFFAGEGNKKGSLYQYKRGKFINAENFK